MKKSIILLALLVYQLSFLSSPLLFAQSTEIRPGILLPQMTTAQRTALSATNGMLVFDTNTQSYWFRQSGTWVNLSAGGSSYWQLNGTAGNEIKNTNIGGFWSAHPTGLNGNSTDVTNPPTAPVSGVGTRLMWIPSRSAFRVGTVESFGQNAWDAANIGLFSFATGYSTYGTGQYSTAMGRYNTASGQNSTTMGYGTTDSGNYSTAIGYTTIASEFASTAMGFTTTASGYASTGMGYITAARGIGSTAMGYTTAASGSYSTTMGYNTTASGNYSTAMGLFNVDNPNAIFMVGNGILDNRANVFTIRGDNNRVGIGTDNPIAPLHVAGQSTITGGTSGRHFNYASNIFSYIGTEYPSIVADASIISKTTIGAFQTITASDARTKTILNRSDNVADLDLLKKIQITNYIKEALNDS